MKSYYVYTYTDPRNGVPFYVGKGRGNRDQNHLCPTLLKRRTFFYTKLRKLLHQGITPEIYRICEGLSEGEAFYWETFFILALGRRDISTGCLCNLTNGGEGHSGLVVSLGTRAKLADANKGKTLSAETRRKISVSQIGKVLSAETRRKMSIAKQNISAETHRKMSKGQKKRFTNPEERAKSSLLRKGKRHSAETRRKISRSHTGKTHSAETRRKMSQAHKSRVRLPHSALTRSRISATLWRKHWLESGGTTRLDVLNRC